MPSLHLSRRWRVSLDAGRTGPEGRAGVGGGRRSRRSHRAGTSVPVVAALLLVAATCSGASPPGDGAAGPPDATPTTAAVIADSPAPPVRVLLAGDSVMKGLAPAFKAAFDDGGRSDVRFLLMPIIQPDPAIRLGWEQPMRAFDPEVIVVSVGPWEFTEIANRGGDLSDPVWREAYVADVLDRWVRFLTAEGASVLWIGNPPIVDPVVSARFALYEELLAALPARWPQVRHLPSVDALNGGPGPEFRDTVTGADGATVRTRQTDGLHLCVAGATRLVTAVAAELAPTVPVRPGWEGGSWRDDTEAFPPERCPPVG